MENGIPELGSKTQELVKEAKRRKNELDDNCLEVNSKDGGLV